MSRRKNSPSNARRRARRLSESIEAASAERRAALADDRRLGELEEHDAQVVSLFAEKRSMLRTDVYAEAATNIEGQPFYRHHPGKAA